MSLFGIRRTMLLLGLMLAAVLACAAVLLVAGSAPVDAANKKDFSGLVGIGGGRKIYMQCAGTGSDGSYSSPGRVTGPATAGTRRSIPMTPSTRRRPIRSPSARAS